MSLLKTKFIGNNVVTNPKLAQMPTLTIKGNDTGGTANAKDLTVAEVNAILGNLSATLAQNQIFVGNASNVATAVAMSGEASIVASGAITLSNAAVIAKVLTGYVSGAGTVAATDSLLQAIQKLNGNNLLAQDDATQAISDAADALAAAQAAQSDADDANAAIGHLQTLSGVAANADDLGTFTGAIIPDSSDVKEALQSLETAIEALPDPIVYKGTWNATTNTPTLDNADTGKTGWLYQVAVAGTVDFGAGDIEFAVGDKVVNNGTIWDKWDMTDAVTSVNGQSGAVVLELGDLDDVNAPSPSDGQVLTFQSGEWVPASTAATSTSTEETYVLNGTDITNQYIDLAHTALGASNSVNSVSVNVAGAPPAVKGADYSVSLTGGSGGVTRITFLNDYATAGACALDATDTMIVDYSF